VHAAQIRTLLKSVIGLDDLGYGAQAHGIGSDAEQGIGLRVAITGIHSIVPCMLDQMGEGAEAAATAGVCLASL
jgi:hypothetical protein